MLICVCCVEDCAFEFSYFTHFIFEYNNSPSFVSHVDACTSIMQVDDELAGEGEGEGEDETEAKAEE